MAETFGSSALRSNGPSISLVDNSKSSNNVGVGNYKGVMLCNRPFGGTLGTKENVASGDKNTFSCGVVPDALGLNVTMASREKHKLHRSKKDSVLSKHKKWLSDLQKTKDRLEREYIDEMSRKDEAHQKFQDSEKKFRQATLTINRSDSTKPESEMDAKVQEALDKARQESQNFRPNVAPSKPSGKQAKPAWAKVEQECEDEDLQFDDEDDLIEFAKGLDFNQYISDMEVQTMMAKLKARIQELEKDVSQENQRSEDAEGRQKMRDMLALMGETASNLSSAKEEDGGNGSVSGVLALAAAKAVLDGDVDMQAVHSTKSVAAMLKAAAQGQSTVINEPKIVTHEPNEGARLEVKNSVSNLPYMHRNPAV